MQPEHTLNLDGVDSSFLIVSVLLGFPPCSNYTNMCPGTSTEDYKEKLVPLCILGNVALPVLHGNHVLFCSRLTADTHFMVYPHSSVTGVR